MIFVRQVVWMGIEALEEISEKALPSGREARSLSKIMTEKTTDYNRELT